MRASLVLATLFALSGPTHAQENNVGRDWTGAFIGVSAGSASGELNNVDQAMATTGPLVGLSPGTLDDELVVFATPDTTDTIEGGTIGFSAGYDWQSGPLVFGVEAALQFGSIDAANSFLATEQGPTYDSVASLVGYGTLAGRLGVSTGSVLLYGVAGLAAGWGEADLSITPGPAGSTATPFVSSTTGEHIGYVLGAGIEVALSDDWSVRSDYRYLDLGSTEYLFRFGTPDGSYVTTTSDMQVHTLQLGLNYRF